MNPRPRFDACEFLAPARGASVNLFRAEAAQFASEGDGRPQIQIGILLRGMVRTETASGLLISDARHAAKIWIMPAGERFAVTAVPGHPPSILGAAIDPDTFAHYLEEASRVRLPLPEVARILEDPVAALGIEAFHRSLWAGTGPLEWESWLVTSLRRLFGGSERPWRRSPSRAASPRPVNTFTPTTAKRYRSSASPSSPA